MFDTHLRLNFLTARQLELLRADKIVKLCANCEQHRPREDGWQHYCNTCYDRTYSVHDALQILIQQAYENEGQVAQ